MTSSELSNALNPYVVQTRSRSLNNQYQNHLQPVVQPPQQHVPHRSELELAISEPAPPPPRDVNVRPRNAGSPAGADAVRELLRLLAATKEANEIERKRRLAWEQEQEARFTQRQAEMERQMLEMRQEIQLLKGNTPASAHTSQNDPTQPTINQTANHTLPVITQQPSPQLSESSTPVGLHAQSRPTFVQGSSSRPMHATNASPIILTDAMTRLPSPEYMHMDGMETQSEAGTGRGQTTPGIDSQDGSESSASSDDESPPQRSSRHKYNGRCLTIQHAIRAHLYRTMRIDSDKHLPDSHIEGTPLPLTEPIRFIWDKTPKQSVHNGRMKARFVTDLKAHRRLYRHIPDKDFSKKTIDSAFDQAFITLRQKFKIQRDESAALHVKQKEEAKALKARRLSRKKNKLTNRSEKRNGTEAFEHVTFDGALQLECMSSEESEPDDAPGSVSRPATTFRIRGLPWRSHRLRNFYMTLDEGDQIDKSTQPRRGLGRRDRCPGPNKEIYFLPPKGVASWMISRKWLNELQQTRPEIAPLMKDIVEDPPGFDWNIFLALGGEDSEEELEPPVGSQMAFNGMTFGHDLDFIQQQYLSPHQPINTSTSSLHNALASI